MDFENIESPFPSPSSSSSPSSSCSPSQKRKAGRRKFKETRHPVYRGVRRRNGNKWVCEVREPNKKSRIWLGTYPTPEMAARAHDAAVLALRGTSALLNFPDSAFLLPLATSSSPSAIRAAAAKAAKALVHPCSISSSSSSSFLQNNTNLNSFLLEEKRLDDESNTEKALEDSSISRERNKNINNEEYRTLFLDEEALYNMPALLDSMAEGLLLTPPSMSRALDWDNIASHDIDLTLWTD